MSHLTDLLSKIKQAEPKKELPPGLLDTIESLKKKDPVRRRVFFFAFLLSAALVLGLFASFLAGRLKTALKVMPAPLSKGPSVQPHFQAGQAAQQNKAQGPVLPFLPSAAPASAENGAAQGAETAETETPFASEPLSDGRAQNRPERPRRTAPEEKVSPKADPEEIAGLLYLARGYELRGEFSSAVESYKKALFLDPADYRAMNNIASLYIRMSSPGQAIAYLEECVKLKDDYLPALVNLGIAKAETGKNREAESSFLKALSFDGSNREALFNIAVLYEKTLEFEKARGYYERLDSLGDPKGAKALERLEGRR